MPPTVSLIPSTPPLGPEPKQVAPNLWGQETEMSHTFEKYWGTIRDWIVALMA